MLCAPVCVYAIPSISLKNMLADRASSWPFLWYFYLAAKAFLVFFHTFSKPNNAYTTCINRLKALTDLPGMWIDQICNAKMQRQGRPASENTTRLFPVRWNALLCLELLL
jgi:hypothetical protein